MKANYKVVNNRQAQLKKVIQNFEPMYLLYLNF